MTAGDAPAVWTVGHSTRALEDFVGVLRAHGIAAIADVRAFPASRRHPHFGRPAFERSLSEAGISYAWLGDTLGGRRRAHPSSPNVAVRNASFRAYADHMETEAFREGVASLLDLARGARTAILCAELLWWRCHRSFLADHLVRVEGVPVFHVEDERPATPHRPRAEARVVDGRLRYDVGANATLFPP